MPHWASRPTFCSQTVVPGRFCRAWNARLCVCLLCVCSVGVPGSVGDRSDVEGKLHGRGDAMQQATKGRRDQRLFKLFTAHGLWGLCYSSTQSSALSRSDVSSSKMAPTAGTAPPPSPPLWQVLVLLSAYGADPTHMARADCPAGPSQRKQRNEKKEKRETHTHMHTTRAEREGPKSVRTCRYACAHATGVKVEQCHVSQKRRRTRQRIASSLTLRAVAVAAYRGEGAQIGENIPAELRHLSTVNTSCRIAGPQTSAVKAGGGALQAHPG